MKRGAEAGVRTLGRIVLVAFLALATLATTPSPVVPPPAVEPTEAEGALQAFTRNRASVVRTYSGRYAIPPTLAREIIAAASGEGIPLRLAFHLVRNGARNLSETFAGRAARRYARTNVSTRPTTKAVDLGVRELAGPKILTTPRWLSRLPARVQTFLPPLSSGSTRPPPPPQAP